MRDELATCGAEFEDGYGGVRSAGEFEHGEADGTSADDEDVVGGGDLGTIHRMTADGEGFDESDLLEVEGIAGMEFVRGQDHALAHAPVAMHAEDLQRFAAVGAAALAGVAGAAVEVRLDGATVADLKMRDAFTHGEDFNTEFMPKDARELDERHLAEVATEVGAADADGADGDEGFALLRRGCFRERGPSEGFGGSESQ